MEGILKIVSVFLNIDLDTIDIQFVLKNSWNFLQNIFFCVLQKNKTAYNMKVTKRWKSNIYIYAFSRRFYPRQLTVHSGYTFLMMVMM